MEDKLQGIVLHSIRYGDSSLIVKIYTRSLGLQSYIIKGAFSRSAKSRAAFFQPLSVVDFVVSGKNFHNTLSHIKDVQIALFYRTSFTMMHKSAIMMYIAELLSKSLTEQEQNSSLYDFILHALLWLDLTEDNCANFPLYFTLELSRFLGFYPKENREDFNYFDMMEGSFVPSIPVHPYYLSDHLAKVLADFCTLDLESAMKYPMNVGQRREFLDSILVFMRLHAPYLKTMQSQEVLKTLFQ